MSAGSNRIWGWRPALWAAVVVLCALVAGLSWAVEASHRRALSERTQQNLRSIALYSYLFVGVRYESRSLDGIEARFNKGQPLPRASSPHPSVTRVVLPGAALGREYEGWEVRLTFGPGAPGRQTLRSYTATPPAAHAGPSEATLTAIARLRRTMIVTAAAAWVLALATLPFARRWRRQVAHVMLAAVVLAAAGWAAEPGRDWSAAGVLAPIPLVLIVAALASLGAILPPVRDSAPACACGGCGYDLTGNVSGVCPECGQPTPRGRVERWRGIAERIEHVGEAQETDELPLPPAEPA